MKMKFYIYFFNNLWNWVFTLENERIMGLNKSTGNMYEFVTHTWNTVKGECPHMCEYCYMKRWGPQKPARFDEKELKTDLGEGNFIFVGSSCDLFAGKLPAFWTIETINHCIKYPKNKYLLQTKNPLCYHNFDLPENFILGTTIESDIWYDQMGYSPPPEYRASAMSTIKNRKFITIEPIMDFNVDRMLEMIKIVNPEWVNIGADSGNNNLPEPSKEKIDQLIAGISSKVTIKKNMKMINGSI